MSHSLNEQVLQIPSGTAADNIELILDGIATAIGGYRSGYGVYFDTNHTAGALFNYVEGNNSCRVDYLANGIVQDYSSTFTLTDAHNFYYHISTDEKTKYLRCGGNNYFIFLYALNTNGDYVCFTGSGQNHITKVGAEGVTMSQTQYYTGDNISSSFAITKAPDIFHTYEFESLYTAQGITETAPLTNCLVSFAGDVYRVVFMNSEYRYAPFAFPVSDPVTP